MSAPTSPREEEPVTLDAAREFFYVAHRSAERLAASLGSVVSALEQQQESDAWLEQTRQEADRVAAIYAEQARQAAAWQARVEHYVGSVRELGERMALAELKGEHSEEAELPENQARLVHPELVRFQLEKKARILGRIGGVPALGPGSAAVLPAAPRGVALKATASAAAREIHYSRVEDKDAAQLASVFQFRQAAASDASAGPGTWRDEAAAKDVRRASEAAAAELRRAQEQEAALTAGGGAELAAALKQRLAAQRASDDDAAAAASSFRRAHAGASQEQLELEEATPELAQALRRRQEEARRHSESSSTAGSCGGEPAGPRGASADGARATGSGSGGAAFGSELAAVLQARRSAKASAGAARPGEGSAPPGPAPAAASSELEAQLQARARRAAAAAAAAAAEAQGGEQALSAGEAGRDAAAGRSLLSLLRAPGERGGGSSQSIASAATRGGALCVARGRLATARSQVVVAAAHLARAARRAAAPVAAGAVGAAAAGPSVAHADAHALPAPGGPGRRVADAWELVDGKQLTTTIFSGDEIDEALCFLTGVKPGSPRSPSAVVEELGDTGSELSSDGAVDALIERCSPPAPAVLAEGLPLDLAELGTVASRLLKSPGVQHELLHAALGDPEVLEILASRVDGLPEYLVAQGFAARGLLMPGERGAAERGERSAPEPAEATPGALDALRDAVGRRVEEAGAAVAALGRLLRGRLGQAAAQAPGAGAGSAGTVLGAVVMVAVAIVAIPLLEAVEELFADSESIVIAAFQVRRPTPRTGGRRPLLRSGRVGGRRARATPARAASAQAAKVTYGGDSTGAALLKALGGGKAPSARDRDHVRPVVVAFSVRRSPADRGFTAAVHFARPLRISTTSSASGIDATTRLELRKTYPLKSLHGLRLTAPPRGQQQQPAAAPPLGEGGGGGADAVVLELRCAAAAHLPEHRGQYLIEGQGPALTLASLVLQLLRQQDAVLPSLGGVTLERLDGWWCGHKEEVAAALTPFAHEVVTPGAITVPRGGADAGASVLVSDKEAAELEELLEFFELGLGESEAFAAALQEEACALEAANVHAMLGAGALVEGTLGQLRHAQGLLDDLDESLKVFDFKLRHMRADIAAVEASNNALERTSAHHAALLALLERLLARLRLPAATAATLEAPPLDLDGLPELVNAGWALNAQRRWLSCSGPNALSRTLGGMAVVADARQAVDDLAARFVGKGVAFVLGLIGQLLADAAAEAGRAGDRAARVRPPDRARLRGVLSRVAPLIQVLAVLEPAALQPVQQHAAAEVNALLRRELRTAGAELRRAAAAELAANGAGGAAGADGDYSLVRERGGAAGGAAPSASGAGSDSASDWADPAELLGGGAGGQGAAKRAAFLDGSSPGLPLTEAWAMLGDFLPALADEAERWADLLAAYRRARTQRSAQHAHGGGAVRGDEEQLHDGPAAAGDASDAADDAAAGGGLRARHRQRRGDDGACALVALCRAPGTPLSPGGARALQAMMAGLDPEFLALAELAGKSHQVLLLPLLGASRAWHAQLAQRPAAAPLAALAGGLAGRLAAQWGAFVSSQVAAAEAYDPRRQMGLQQGVKHVHVLPLVSQLCLLAHDLELVLADAPRVNAAGAGGKAAADAARSVRAEADAAYGALLPAALSRLERLAGSDPKYGERLRLENYAFLGASLAPLAAATPALQHHWQACESRRKAALAAYVGEQLVASKFWRLLEFGDRLDKLLQVVSPPEVAFQKDCSAAEVRGLMRATMDGTDKKLEAMVTRLRKHLGAGRLFGVAWGAVKEALLVRYEHLEELLEACYPTTPLRPAPEEIKELFRATSAG
ncbi:SEC3A [Scenedesmus sp. PABB004]|nr:SEC3A [Scenedesmus sp. PABB004]